jgi:hypothetical protein
MTKAGSDPGLLLFRFFVASPCAPRMSAVEIRESILSADGSRKAALVDIDTGGESTHAGSQVLVADANAADFDPDAQLAVFDARAERIEWSGADLLVAFPAGAEAGVFSLFPGLRVRPAPGSDGLSWLRLSTRHCRR